MKGIERGIQLKTFIRIKIEENSKIMGEIIMKTIIIIEKILRKIINNKILKISIIFSKKIKKDFIPLKENLIEKEKSIEKLKEKRVIN